MQNSYRLSKRQTPLKAFMLISFSYFFNITLSISRTQYLNSDQYFFFLPSCSTAIPLIEKMMKVYSAIAFAIKFSCKGKKHQVNWNSRLNPHSTAGGCVVLFGHTYNHDYSSHARFVPSPFNTYYYTTPAPSWLPPIFQESWLPCVCGGH